MIIVWLICIENILDYIICKNEKIYTKEFLQTIFEDRVMLLGGCQCSVIGINFFINMIEMNNLLEIHSFSIFIVLILEFIKLILILKIPKNKLSIGIFIVKIFCFLGMSILLIQKII
ncbi:MAG: hypothetical protein E7F83_03330 [Clostridium sp.]|uniref:DUF5658 domain-containing protein n=1 Tax=Clostridium tertium TaxID=1559 RepID=A0A6N3FS28_9CLOT|nr:hypothetical protein [Clostridium sp.]MDU3546436.1 hypothetical protein [Clostridium sp.]